MGAVYSVSVVGKYRYFPEESVSLEIEFSCDPERISQLQQAVLKHVDELRRNGPEESEVKKVSKQILTSHEEYQRDDVYWLSRFLELVRRGKTLSDLVDTVAKVRKMNSDLLGQLFPSILDMKNTVELIQIPKED